MRPSRNWKTSGAAKTHGPPPHLTFTPILSQQSRMRRRVFLLLPLCAAEEYSDGRRLAASFAAEVNPQLELPPEEQIRYAWQLTNFALAGSQYVAIVDRDPHIQALMLYWKAPAGHFHYIGASPVSTGLPGSFDHFETPLGAFPHVMANHDYRALGTRNQFGIRGYGRKGLRVFDLGWTRAAKGWGDRRELNIRFQLHSCDPTHLEPKLGTRQSKGCVHIHATLNEFLDRYGVLDADYQRAVAEGQRPFVLGPNWQPTPWSGRYLIVVDTGRAERPAWSPMPSRKS